MRYTKIIIAVAAIAIDLCAFCVYAEEPAKGPADAPGQESQYSKDTVPVEGSYACQIGYDPACELPVLLNKETGRVEYFWSSSQNKWIAAGDQQITLQALYDKRKRIRDQRQLKEMQEEMDKNRSSGMRLEFQSQSVH